MTVTPNLHGHVVAFSMSPPADLGRVGFPPAELDRVIFNLCMRVTRAQGRILYGGHLQDGSLTARMFDFVATAYVSGSERGGAVKPFLHLLPLSEFKRAPFARLLDIQQKFGSFLETRIVVGDDDHLTVGRRSGKLSIRDADGKRDAILIGEPEGLSRFAADLPMRSEPQALTTMRSAAERMIAARFVLGGKRGDLGVSGERDRFHGAMPGIYEEAIASIEARIPTIVLAAYGGAARDIAIDLGLIDPGNAIPFLGEVQPGYREARERMASLREHLNFRTLETMSQFALREDCEDLARDATEWLGARLATAGDL